MYFLRNASDEDKETAQRCLEILKFGVSNCLVCFQGQYWEYAGDMDVMERGLTIGGFESAILADLVAAWLLENTVELMLDTCLMASMVTTASLYLTERSRLKKFASG